MSFYLLDKNPVLLCFKYCIFVTKVIATFIGRKRICDCLGLGWGKIWGRV